MRGKACFGSMKEKQPSLEAESKSERLVRAAVLLWVIGITVFHLGSAIRNRPIYRDQHLGTALEYSKGSINLLKPVVVGFNLNNAPTPQELPVWQAATGLAFKLFGTWYGWGNVVSLVLFFSCLYPLFRLAESFAGAGTGCWSLLLFLAQPMVFIAAGEGSPDGLSIATSIWFMFFATKLWSEPTAMWLVLTIVAGTLSAVFKLPFFTAVGFGCCFMTLKDHWAKKDVVLRLALAAMVISAGFYFWQRYVNYCYTQAELPFVDLRTSNSETFKWFFGDLKYRLSPGVWIKGAWRALMALFGSFLLVGLFFLSFVLRSSSRLGRWWLVGGMVTTFIFFHVVLHHHHYYLMFAPPVAMLSATVSTCLEKALIHLAPGRKRYAILLVVFSLALSTVQGVLGEHVVLFVDDYPYAMSKVIKQYTKETDKLVIQGGGWGGQFLFLADRKGLTVWDSKLLEDHKIYDRLRQLGFNKLVMVSETPMLTAVRHTHETSATMKRQSYEAAMTPIVKTLPTIIQNEDILIKELP
jgi:hypothetical protein